MEVVLSQPVSHIADRISMMKFEIRRDFSRDSIWHGKKRRAIFIDCLLVCFIIVFLEKEMI